METIYKGLQYALELEINDQDLQHLDLVVRFYNKPTQTVVDATVAELDGSKNTYIASLSATQTRNMPIGMYSLDVIDNSTNEMLYHVDNHAHCVVSSEKID